MANLKKLASIAKKPKTDILTTAKQRKANRKWLRYSQSIALIVLDILDQPRWSQKILAEKMEVSPQYINKLLKGKEKLNIETIAKLETALDISLININEHEKPAKNETKVIKVSFNHSFGPKIFDNYIPVTA